MLATVEISMYPLSDDYIQAVDSFLTKVREFEGLKISTNPSSTRILGEYDQVMKAVTESMKLSYEDNRKAVFVMKVLNSDKESTKWDDR